ncbi:MAG: choice-of-anchor J domain-containing protein, partial [Bacteroidales bacterium]|nr:choice-of-anchor J domain-containing protein [Bacteroidales bacterium]
MAREVAGFGQKNLAVETTAASEINSDLSSIKPSSVVYTDNTKDGWITWAGESVYHLFGMGAVQAGIYARFEATDLASYAGQNLTQIKFNPYNHSSLPTQLNSCSVRVYVGGSYSGTTYTPGTLVVDQAVTDYTLSATNVVTLDTPVPITGTEEIWFGVFYDVTQGYVFSASQTTESTCIEGKSNLINYYYAGGTTYDLWGTSSTMFTTAYYFNWWLAAYTETEQLPCEPLTSLPYTQGFEGDFPTECWTMVYGDGAGASNPMSHNDLQAYEGTYSFRFSSFNTTSDYNQYLISPEIADGATDLNVSFYSYSPYYGSEYLSVGYSMTGTDVADFTWGDPFEVSTTAWTLTETAIPDGAKYVAIHYDANWMYYTFVDAFTLSGTVPGGGCNDVVITVGEGTTGTYFLPCNTFYKYSYVQQIYTADEMEVSDAGQISTVAFQYIYSTAQTKNPVSIYMGNTDKENFTSNTDWVSVGDMQLVYSGSVTFDNTGTDNWVTITFDTPFDYEGGNVVVAFLNNNGAYTTGSNNTFYCHTNPGNRVLYYRVDGSSPINPATPPSASSYTYGYRNNIKFDACLSSAPILCPKPDDILVSNIGENSAEISWTETGSATEWNIELLLEGQVQGEGTIYSVSNTPSFTLTELDPNTDYTVYVQANCGGSNGTSEWKGPKSFTTLCSAFYLPFSEGFEAGEFSNCWSQEYVSGTHAWIVRTNASNPSAPHSGNYNAAYAHSSTGSKTKLVSPKFDLSGNANANMLFWHAQKVWTGDQDELRVYYKNAPDGEWTMIAEYTESIPEWTQEAITLPNLTSTYWIAFEGLDDYGYGVVLDDIYIYEPVYTQIAGNVTYLGNGVAGAEVYLDGEIMDYTATTDANGLYTMLIEAATYTVTASAEGYNETVIEGYEAVSPICLLNIELTAPILAITPAEIVVRTTYGTDGYAAVRLTNEGNGPGSWRMVKDYLDKSINNINGVTISNTPNNISYPAAVDGSPYTSIIEGGNNSKAAWDLVNSFTATAGGMQGVATDGEYVYLTSWQASPTAGWSFEKYDLDLNFVEGFSISGVAQLRDLTYDGTYFYGGSGSTLYCLDLANQTLVSSVSTGVGTIRHCTYDPANDGFWVGNWTDLYLINRAGTVQFTGPAPASAYGSGYDYITEGGPYLLLFCQPNSNAVVYQYDIANNVITGQIFDFASMPGYNASISGGAFVGAYGDKVCFFGNLQQAPNLIGIYELGDVPVDGWLSSEITSGTLEAGESVDILFRMDGLWAEEGEFHANVYFNPTPNSGAVVLPVTFIIGPSACPMPIDLTAELKGQYLYEDLNDVVLHWGIEASGSGTLEPVLEETFEAGAIPDGWTILDEDGDGYFWNAEYGYGLFVGHTGECISSASYINNAGALTPDNWLITPQIALDGGNVNYWVNAQDASYAYEHYGVYISTTGTDPDDFTLLFEETMTAKGDKYVGERGSRDQGAWYERTIDLTGITGNVYIAFRHFNCTDAFWLN